MPSDQKLRVLIAEDDPRGVRLMTAMLEDAGYQLKFSAVDTPEAFQKQLACADFEVILSDYNLRNWTAIDALEILKKSGKQIPFVIVSGSLGDEAAVECIKRGATDYVLKDRMARLPFAIERALSEERSRTERERLEAQLIQSQKLEAIGRLAGGVAHDFNNLLTVITGYSELLLARINGKDPHHQPVQQIKTAAERAASLTRQLLAFSRKQVLVPQVIDFNTLVADMDKMLRRLIGEDIDLATLCGSGLGRVKADPSQIEQVIMNLAVNARDAMPNGGKLTIETSNAYLGSTYTQSHVPVKSGPYVMLAVTDTGSGMDKETQSQIFEPFFTTKEVGKGTGLGLSMVYGIVKQSGGYIWVYSEVGRGTTFKVYLPQVEGALETKETFKGSAETQRGTETILVVEDDDSLRSLVRTVLGANGYTVLEAHRGQEALRICEEHKSAIHLILTDVVMPQMNGRELAERVARVQPRIKVLFMSGYTDNAIVHHGELEAGTPFIQKPFTPDALARKVREVLAAQSNISDGFSR